MMFLISSIKNHHPAFKPGSFHFHIYLPWNCTSMDFIENWKEVRNGADIFGRRHSCAGDIFFSDKDNLI